MGDPAINLQDYKEEKQRPSFRTLKEREGS